MRKLSGLIVPALLLAMGFPAIAEPAVSGNTRDGLHNPPMITEDDSRQSRAGKANLTTRLMPVLRYDPLYLVQTA